MRRPGSDVNHIASRASSSDPTLDRLTANLTGLYGCRFDNLPTHYERGISYLNGDHIGKFLVDLDEPIFVSLGDGQGVVRERNLAIWITRRNSFGPEYKSRRICSNRLLHQRRGKYS